MTFEHTLGAVIRTLIVMVVVVTVQVKNAVALLPLVWMLTTESCPSLSVRNQKIQCTAKGIHIKVCTQKWSNHEAQNVN